MSERSEAKFRAGQVVAIRGGKEPVFRIQEVFWDDGWFYRWNRNNAASESMIRELTAAEKGGCST